MDTDTSIQVLGLKVSFASGPLMKSIRPNRSLTFKDALEKALKRVLGIERKHRPLVILIAGCSRSGKSTLAKCLCEQLSALGYKSTIVELDWWVVPASQRAPFFTVSDRFNLAQLEKDLEQLLEGGEVSRSVYQSQEREASKISKTIRLPLACDFIIIEGVVALLSQYLKSNANLRIFLKIRDLTRIRRLITFYKDFKRLESNEFFPLIIERELEEVQTINGTEEFADLIIRLKD